LIAIHRLLREGIRPARDLYLCLGNVEAARTPPVLSHRTRVGGEDLNRKFIAPFEGVEGKLAQAILESIEAAEPELVVDLHNTSGRGPSYAVCTSPSSVHHAIASLFVERVVDTDLVLNSLMEGADRFAPSVTVECGGASQPRSHEVAYAGLRRVAQEARAPQDIELAGPLAVLGHPLRVELVADAHVAFADHAVESADITLDPDIDLHNFGRLAAGEPIGWLGARGLEVVRVVGAKPVDTTRLFEARDGRLVAKRPLEPLMVTIDPEIAISDCLMYVVEV
jgi:hypothetical protein